MPSQGANHSIPAGSYIGRSREDVLSAVQKRNESAAKENAGSSEAQYTCAVYAFQNNGAAIVKSANIYAGHAGLLLVKSDGTFVVYSYGRDIGSKKFGDPGAMMTHEDPVTFATQGEDIAAFLKYGRVAIHHEGKNDEKETGHNDLAQCFSSGLVIPISNEQGIKMYEKGEEWKNNPQIYNLIGNSCDDVVQDILAQAGIYTGSAAYGKEKDPEGVYVLPDFLVPNWNADTLAQAYERGLLPEGWEYGFFTVSSPKDPWDDSKNGGLSPYSETSIPEFEYKNGTLQRIKR